MKKLYRSKQQVISGVCGGLATYFGIDPVIVRILFIVFLISNLGIYPIIAYLIMSFIIPVETDIIDIEN